MALDPQLARQLRQTVYVATVAAARDVNGQPTFGSPASRVVRWETRRGVVAGPNGQELTTDFWMATTTAVGLLDRVWPPGADQTTVVAALKPKKVEACVDEVGATQHYEVWL